MSSSSKISPAIEVDENENSSLSSNKRSEAYQYFTFKTQRWYCNYCSKNFGDKSTSTLWRHIAKHPKIVEAQRFSQKGFRKRTVRWVVVNDQPFNVIENEEFKDMISFIWPGIYIPCANTLRRDLTENFKNAKERFRQELQETPGRLSFTVDAWTSKNQIPFLGSHTGVNLSSKFLESLEDFGIATKILAVACDNASNMDVMLDKISQSLAKKSITFYPKNQRVRCFAHVINLAAKKLIDNLQVPLLYEDENSFEEAEDTEDNLKDTIYKHYKKCTDLSVSQQYPTLSYTIPMYNFLLDKLEDEYDKRKESDKEEDEEEDDDDSDDDNESENDEILCALKQSIKKIKKYYTFTSELIYTAATATSAPVERIFSGGTDLVVQKRCSLKESTIRETMCLKGWWKSGVGGSIIIND
ncbi:unnamed protein product [Rhizophagus irregularis]|nr:unnamed protein product [Rhizophagus irregularis]